MDTDPEDRTPESADPSQRDHPTVEAQAGVATAHGQAFDASIAIGQAQAVISRTVSRTLTLDAEIAALQESAGTSADSTTLGDIRREVHDLREDIGTLPTILEEIRLGRAESSSGGATTTRFNWAFLAVAVAGIVIGVIGVAVAIFK